MTAGQAAFPLLCFAADDTRMAVAADDVVAIEPANPAAPYVGLIIDVPSDRSLNQQRSLWLARGTSVFEVVVDSPVKLAQCTPGDIVPVAPGIPRHQWRPVLGFARLDGAIVLLFDSRSLIAALIAARRGGQS